MSPLLVLGGLRPSVLLASTTMAALLEASSELLALPGSETTVISQRLLSSPWLAPPNLYHHDHPREQDFWGSTVWNSGHSRVQNFIRV